MTEGYRNDLAAAQARIAELEAKLSDRAALPDIQKLVLEHGKLARGVPSKRRVQLTSALAAFIMLLVLSQMLSGPSRYDSSPHLTLALQLLMAFTTLVSAMLTWLARSHGLKAVALSRRLRDSELARASLEADHVRVGEPVRISPTEDLEEGQKEPASEERRMGRHL